MSLLPIHSASLLEQQLSHTLSPPIETLPVDIPLIWQPTAPEALLPLLAENLTVSFLTELTESEKEKRQLIQNAIAIYKKLGTPSSIQLLCQLLQFGQVEIQSLGDGKYKYNGKHQYNRTIRYSSSTRHWYEYRMIIDRPVPKEKVAKLKQMLPLLAPARCRLVEVKTKEPIKYNGLHQYNGEFTFGSY